MKKWIFIILMTLNSCASNFEEERESLLNKTENKDLVSSFELTNDDISKFKETEAEAHSNIAPPQKIEIQKTLKKKAKNKTAPVEVKKIAEVKNEKAEFQYPDGYPELFKKYDLKSKQIWSQFKPVFFKGEQSIMDVNYMGVTAGYITIMSKGIFKLNNRLAYDFYARFKSKDSLKYFYWLDDSIESFVDKETFLPIKYTLIQREKKQNVDDLQLFDLSKLKNYSWYKRVKEGANKDEKKEAFIPMYLQDSFSALQFVRGLPLKKGDLYEFPVATRGTAWILKIEVIDEEKITIMDKEVLAVKIKAETHFPGVLKKSGDINFWYSADEFRKLLKFQAKVKIGSLYGELIEYRPGVLVN